MIQNSIDVMWEYSIWATGPIPPIVLFQGLQSLCPVWGAGPGIHWNVERSVGCNTGTLLVRCSAFNWNAVDCNKIHCNTLHCIAFYSRLIPSDCGWQKPRDDQDARSDGEGASLLTSPTLYTTPTTDTKPTLYNKPTLYITPTLYTTLPCTLHQNGKLQ